MRGLHALAGLLAIVGLITPSWAELPLPAHLVALSSYDGTQLLLDSQYRSDYMLLSQHFVTQVNSAFCGPASSVTVLNALGTPRPPQDAAAGFTNPSYAYYTQDNVFDDNTEKVVAQSQVRQEGMSLEELSQFLGAHQGVSSTYLHTDTQSVSVDMFRDTIVRALAMPQMFVIVNFDRSVLTQYGGGHHSPVAAYNRATDSVLVLDVSRYKYIAWWVSIVDLYHSTSKSLDSSSNLTRGLVVVWASNVYGSHFQMPKPGSALPVGMDNGSPLVVARSTVRDTDNRRVRPDGMSPGAATGLAMAMLVAGAMCGLVFSMWLNAKRRDKAIRSLSGAMSDSFNTHGEVAMTGKWPWPGSIYAGYRDGMGVGKGVQREEDDGERRLLGDNDGTNKV